MWYRQRNEGYANVADVLRFPYMYEGWGKGDRATFEIPVPLSYVLLKERQK